jgi:site-specific recombinase XerD
LFIASQGKNKNKRISAQTVDGLIKRYAIASGIKNADRLSPNKLRQMKFLEGGDSL